MQKKRPALPLGAAYSHARKVEAETGGGQKKQHAVAARYLKKKGMRAMAKASGEGSRGGHVIAHTAQGHPIYQSGTAKTDYGHFKAMDHLDAARAHLDISAQAVKDGNVALSRQHRQLASAHSTQGRQLHAREMKQLAKPKVAAKAPKAAASAFTTQTGGKVHVGRSASHASYKKFGEQDHLEAAGHHLQHAKRAAADNRFDDARRHMAVSQEHSDRAKAAGAPPAPAAPKRRSKTSLEREDVRQENKPTGYTDVAASRPKRLQNSMTGKSGSPLMKSSPGTLGAYQAAIAQSSAPGHLSDDDKYAMAAYRRLFDKNADNLARVRAEILSRQMLEQARR